MHICGTGMTSNSGIPLFLAVYAILNLIAFAAFGLDKRKAQRSSWRIPERVLLFLALCGPFGAYGAMRKFRHKTQKTLFLLVPAFLVLHCIILLYCVVKLPGVI